MHVVIIVLLLLALGFLVNLLLQPRQSAAGEAGKRSDSPVVKNFGDAGAGLQVAFISGGKLFYSAEHGEVRQLQSPYIQEVSDRLEKSKERNAWKQNTSFGIAAGGNVRQFDSDGANIVATSAQFYRNSILYFLKDESMGGLFAYDLTDQKERRLLHKQNLNLADLNLDQVSGKILCSSRSKNGVSNIAMLDCDGNQFRELTGGDTFDSAPTWVSADGKEIFFQSAGLARNEAGYIMAQGNATIQRLDLNSGSITPVLEDPNFDYLQPRLCPQGHLYFIRRPYEPPRYQTGNLILDTLLFPFRLLRAVFHYLNFFSMMYSRKPLTSASGSAVQADLKQIMLKGKRIDAEKALRREAAVNGVPSLVPRSWQLIQRSRQGDERVLACNVLSYFITPEADIVYSNGRGVFTLGDGERSSLILKGDLVDEVIAHSPALNKHHTKELESVADTANT